MTESKQPVGRPLKFDSVEELEFKINGYFDDCDKEEDSRVWSHDEIVTDGKKSVCCLCRRPERSKGCMLIEGTLKKRRPYTVTGLAVWLDTSRQTLLDYEVRPEFLDTIKRGKQKIELCRGEAV